MSLIFFWQALSREEPASVAAPATLETKVRNDSLPVGLIQQDILKLHVPVDDALAVQVTQPRKDLSEEKPGDLLMSHRLPPDDGRLPLQVLGDLGLLDLVKCHHLQSHLLVQNDGVGQYLSSSSSPLCSPSPLPPSISPACSCWRPPPRPLYRPEVASPPPSLQPKAQAAL